MSDAAEVFVGQADAQSAIRACPRCNAEGALVSPGYCAACVQVMIDWLARAVPLSVEESRRRQEAPASAQPATPQEPAGVRSREPQSRQFDLPMFRWVSVLNPYMAADQFWALVFEEKDRHGPGAAAADRALCVLLKPFPDLADLPPECAPVVARCKQTPEWGSAFLTRLRELERAA